VATDRLQAPKKHPDLYHGGCVGSYLAARLSQIGLKHHFVVAGDLNLVLLDQLLTNKKLEQVGCCNELNCVYSAAGDTRLVVSVGNREKAHLSGRRRHLG